MGTFADALRGLLDERHVSQRELARRLEISPQAVNSWVTAGIIPTRDNVTRVEDELAVEPRGWLVSLAGYSPDTDQEQTVESLIRADPGLEPEDKRVLLRLLTLARERYAHRPQAE